MRNRERNGIWTERQTNGDRSQTQKERGVREREIERETARQPNNRTARQTVG